MAEIHSSLVPLNWLPRAKVRDSSRHSKEYHSDLNLGVNCSIKCKVDDQWNSHIQDCPSSKPFISKTSADGKPPYSYASLISFAINSSPVQKMTLNEIYHWIMDNFPYYKDAGVGWKVSNIFLMSFCLFSMHDSKLLNQSLKLSITLVYYECLHTLSQIFDSGISVSG